MLTQYLHYKPFLLFYILLTTSVICSDKYVSRWGDYSIVNQSSVIQNKDIIDIIDNHTEYMYSKFGNITPSFFKVIISNQRNNLYNNNFWNWSLGITKNNTIIIKDISKSHRSKEKLFEVLIHELNHLYLNRLTPNSQIPRWFEEGFAMFYANEKLSFNQFVLAANINKKKHFDLELLNSLFYSNSKKQFNFAYTYSQFLFSKIIDDYSEKIIINMIANMKSGDVFEDAFYKNILLTINDYNKEASLKISSKFWWLRFMKFPSLLLVLAPLLSIIGFILVKIKNQKIIKKWDIEESLDIGNEIEE